MRIAKSDGHVPLQRRMKYCSGLQAERTPAAGAAAVGLPGCQVSEDRLARDEVVPEGHDALVGLFLGARDCGLLPGGWPPHIPVHLQLLRGCQPSPHRIPAINLAYGGAAKLQMYAQRGMLLLTVSGSSAHLCLTSRWDALTGWRSEPMLSPACFRLVPACSVWSQRTHL